MNDQPDKPNYRKLVLVLAIAHFCCWPVTIATTQTSDKKKLVVTMDSPSFPYDPENQGRGRSNTDEIVAILEKVKGLSVVPIATSFEGTREREVKAKNPDLILIHWSAFAASPRSKEKERAADDKFNSFLSDMADSKSRILVYTRHRFPDQKGGYKLLVERWVRIVPQLKGRIEIFEFVPGKPQRFRDPAVQEALRLRVKQLLALN